MILRVQRQCPLVVPIWLSPLKHSFRRFLNIPTCQFVFFLPFSPSPFKPSIVFFTVSMSLNTSACQSVCSFFTIRPPIFPSFSHCFLTLIVRLSACLSISLSVILSVLFSICLLPTSPLNLIFRFFS